MALDASMYTPLRTDGQIRLTKVESVVGGVVQCALKDINLGVDRGLDYVAVSYTWGPATDEEAANGVNSEPTEDVKCNGGSLKVTKNLFSFLCRAVDEPAVAGRWLWIDAICIHQANQIEKESQVNLMASIYHSASLVLIWLGEEDDNTTLAFDLIRSLASYSDKELELITPKMLTVGNSAEHNDPKASRASWTALIELFRRRYFTRAWIIQEVTLATHRIALCGVHTIPWDAIVAVSKFLTITSWTRWVYTERTPGATQMHAFNHTNPNFIEANRRTAHAGDPQLMLISLIRARRFQASDARDKVYALLGVAAVATKAKPRFEPVYGKRTVEEVYFGAAVQILMDSDDLLLLAHAEGEKFRTHSNLPSWVPDWSVTKAVGLGVTGYGRYSAAGDGKRYLEINERARSLVVRGRKLDHVVAVAESKEDILRGRPFPRLLKMLCSMQPRYRPATARIRGDRLPHWLDQQPAEVLWRVLITDTGGAKREHPAPPQFVTAGLTWIRSRILASAQSIDPEIISESLERIDLEASKARTGTGMDADEYEATMSYAQHLRPLTSGAGYFGVGSESTQEGDEIWIILGSRVPLLLRPTTDRTYSIIGGAYIHGAMAAEAFESADNFEKITII